MRFNEMRRTYVQNGAPGTETEPSSHALQPLPSSDAVPLGQATHRSDTSLYDEPGAQDVHETEPGSLEKPVAQGVHASAPPVESVFLGHWTCPLLATLVLFPAPTLWQNAAPAAANWPAEHLTHEASAPPVLKLSAPHSVHSVHSVAWPRLNFPAGQKLQSSVLSPALYFPASHAVHWPALALAWQ